MVVATLMLAAACGGTTDETTDTSVAGPVSDTTVGESSPPTGGDEPTKVALLLPGPITDGGWDQIPYEGFVVVGNPKGADAETGELEIRAMVDQLALALEEFATLEFMS